MALEGCDPVRLMAGALPPEAEECFAEAGVALFPARDADLITYCDCPDFSNPCKHIAAVYYLLAEQFDRGPFLLLGCAGWGASNSWRCSARARICPPRASWERSANPNRRLRATIWR